jgi:hypothetical protein
LVVATGAAVMAALGGNCGGRQANTSGHNAKKGIHPEEEW